MQTVLIDYEAFYGLAERPFSLTSDPKFHFRSRSHARAADLLTYGLRRREGLLLITGDIGIGKTTLARTLALQTGERTPTAYVPHPLLAPEDLLRLLLQEMGAVSARDAWEGRLRDAARQELHELLAEFLSSTIPADDVAVIVIDEAQSLPPSIVAEIVALESLEARDARVLQIVLVGQAATGSATNLANRQIDQRVVTRARLLPLEREECAGYVEHRLSVARGASADIFTARAIDTLYDLSGGVPRLINLLCERALHEGALVGASRIEPPMIDRAASALELTPARSRRFRWFGN
jgi:general secretion pathway protein A